ncbi:hypothetical protein WA026_023341 [Henosepilachna vigintioctopunctata]|uniref:Uncharacterized protein n=1 Tax=Henosepilachna vigintioctopunctata TaxID=420089 RepID=A0AAW1VIZ9_9CUCU
MDSAITEPIESTEQIATSNVVPQIKVDSPNLTTSSSTINDEIRLQKEPDFRPKKVPPPSIDGKNYLLIPYIRLPLINRTKPTPSIYILFFVNSIIHADHEAIPDYTNPTTFDNTELRTIYGSQFLPEQWTRTQKDYLLNPVTLYSPESTPDLDCTFNMNGKDLGLPVIGEDDAISTVEEFLAFSNTDWLRSAFWLRRLIINKRLRNKK